jgi:dolichol-phosphate mannosyltransferase
MGLLFLVFALVIGIQSLVRFFSGTAQEGFTTVYMLILLAGSFIMIGLGVIGYYMSKIYEEIKFRPRYIISVDTKDRKEKDNNNGEKA